MSADGAYDTKGCHAAIADRDGHAAVPPRDGAVPSSDDHPRYGIFKDIAAAKGSAGWKNDSDYHRRSIAENMMYRLKQLGDSLHSRTFEPRVTEATSGPPSSTLLPVRACRNPSGLGKFSLPHKVRRG